jgi:hypothetical protein
MELIGKFVRYKGYDGEEKTFPWYGEEPHHFGVVVDKIQKNYEITSLGYIYLDGLKIVMEDYNLPGDKEEIEKLKEKYGKE